MGQVVADLRLAIGLARLQNPVVHSSIAVQSKKITRALELSHNRAVILNVTAMYIVVAKTVATVLTGMFVVLYLWCWPRPIVYYP